MLVVTPRLIYRITHRANVPWILRNGVHCRSHPAKDPAFVNIGHPELIEKRNNRVVPIPPGGTLADYVPFYFCTRSVMLYNLHTGRVPEVDVRQSDIVYVVSSIERLEERGRRFLFTDRHAYVAGAVYRSGAAELARLDWPLIRSRDFKRDPKDPGKVERRAAECLVHEHVPLDGLLGFACYDAATQDQVKAAVDGLSLGLHVKLRPDWYF